jgi:hypothetical protein
MADAPVFVDTPIIGIANIATGVTARDGTGAYTNVVTATTAGNGVRIEEIVIQFETDAADSTVILWIHDGSTSYIFDDIDVGNPAAGSTTVAAYRTTKTYTNLVLPVGYSLKASVTVTPTTGDCNVIALGGRL